MDNINLIIEEALRHHKTRIDFSQNFTDNDVYMSIRNIMRNNPDMFWFSHQWNYNENENILFLRYTLDNERSQKASIQINDVITNDFCIEKVRTLPIIEQVMYVYKWVALYCKYNIYSAYNQSIYSVFVYRNSVCTGIAKATQYLFQLLGIESKLVFGRMNNSDINSRHCWLIVLINGLWYHLDPTFAIPETDKLLYKLGIVPKIGQNGLFYNFFCTDTATIRKSRNIENVELLPCCNGTIDYALYQDIKVFPSRHGDKDGLGCNISDTGTTADIYLAHSHGILSVAKVFKDDNNPDLLRKELTIMKECENEPHLLHTTNVDYNKGILYIEQATALSELFASHYFKLTVYEFCHLLLDIIAGIKELQRHGIKYRDIHIKNIYLSNTPENGRYTYKIGDFGSCSFFKGENKYDGFTEKGGIGSKWYLAPESCKSGIFNESSSVYSVGMVAYHILNNFLPPLWQSYGEKSHELRINGMELPLPCSLLKKEYKNLNIEFISKAICFNESDRYHSLIDFENAIHSYIINNPHLMSVVIFKGAMFQDEGLNQPTIDFNSTCIENPYITPPNANTEIFQCDCISDESLEYLDNISIEDYCSIPSSPDSPSIDCFANTCGDLQGKYSHVDYYAEDNYLTESSSIDIFATTCGVLQNNKLVDFDDDINEGKEYIFKKLMDLCSSAKGIECGANFNRTDSKISFSPDTVNKENPIKKFFNYVSSNLFGKVKAKEGKNNNNVLSSVNSSIFAPSEAKRGDYMMIQVFLYQDGEENIVLNKAKVVDPTAIQRNYTPLSIKLRHGDIVKVVLTTHGNGVQIEEPIQELTWNGGYTDCQFCLFISEQFKSSTLLSTVTLFVNNVPSGKMMFKTNIVKQPNNLYTKIDCKSFHKIFISYCHKDESKVKFIAEAYRAQGVDYFFDRHYLKGGDIYPDKIKNYISSADLFILCWSKNAAESEYVNLERSQALALAYPQVEIEKASITIHPISIEPYAEYPADMNSVYNFEKV